jgi:hypothetical protein
MLNAKVNHATGALVNMRSVEPGANPQIPINQPIPNFPATPDALSDMPGILPFLRFPFSGSLD